MFAQLFGKCSQLLQWRRRHRTTPQQLKIKPFGITMMVFRFARIGLAKELRLRRTTRPAERIPSNGATVPARPFTLPFVSLCFGAAVLVLHPLAHGQVYECREGAKSVFSGTPCDADSTPLEVKPAAGDYNRLDDVRARLRTESGRVELKRIDDERAARRHEAAVENAARRKIESERCVQIGEARTRAQRLAKTLRHPDHARREKEAAEKLSEREFFECRRAERLR
ncbi:hypothetical protein PA01_10100 [Azoarcus sp. PA01]|nr:hypothetical protein PA01_10100 [Azoarcus sp. PA01]